jgi:hypothetical protein
MTSSCTVIAEKLDSTPKGEGFPVRQVSNGAQPEKAGRSRNPKPKTAVGPPPWGSSWRAEPYVAEPFGLGGG